MGEARDTLEELVYLLLGLSRTGDVLYIGAHPDDEENGLVALLSRHYGVRTVYWSATRGEGGQSRVAPYAGVELGVYRTWESLAASEADGGERQFGPFYDYGYSKTGAEALQKWGEERLVRELVRAIRAVQPQVVISRWRGDASDGHGHHTAVGIAVKEAFAAAGDPSRFADLEEVGLAAWQPRKLYVGMLVDYQPGEDVEVGVRRPDLESDGCLELNTGDFDAIAGLTFEEQGALARNEHLTQGVGTIPTLGDYYVYLRLVDVAPGSDLIGACSLYDGLDATLTGLADYPGDGAVELRSELAELTEIAQGAAAGFRVDKPWQTGTVLLELARRFRELRTTQLAAGKPAGQALARYLRRKEVEVNEAAAACLGIRIDVDLERASLMPGESARLRCRLWSYGLETPTDIEFDPAVALPGAAVRRVDGSGDGTSAEFEIVIPANAELTTPYWLREPGDEYSYVWPELPYVGEAFDPSLIQVTCSLRIASQTFELTRPALSTEQFVGGYRQLEPSILPPISVDASTPRHVRAARDVPQQLEFSIGVLSHSVEPVEGVVEIEVPDGWTVEPARADVSFRKAGEADSIPVQVTIGANSPTGTHEIRYGIRCSGRLYEASKAAVMQTAPGLGGEPDEGTCIHRQLIAKPCVVKVDLIDVAVHEEHTIGYVAGVGDTVMRLLRSLGLSVQELSDEDLAHAPLESFDTIVVGANAFIVRDALRKAARRLLAYAHQGGTLVVQYQGYPHEGMGATPFPFHYNEPHDRVTDEHAPVRIVRPDHFFFSYPNQLDANEFEGWIRDRGMYFFGEWDSAYEPLLGCADPDEDEKLGGLLVARYGRGLYAYCGYTLFRQLPAGVRGAFRLFANLVALPEARIRWRMEHLRGVSAFAELSDGDLHRVATIVTERTLSADEYLFNEGDEGAELFVIVSGALDVLRQGVQVGSSGPGTTIGELAAFTGLRRSATLRASDETHLFAIHSDDFMSILRQDPDLAEHTIRLLAGRLSSILSAPREGGPLLTFYE